MSENKKDYVERSSIVKYANIMLIFLGGFIAAGFFIDQTVVTSVPFLAMLGAFIGILVNRTKHLDDLNMTRKKDVCLKLIGDVSKYGTVLVSLIEPNTTLESFYSNINKANKKMISSLNMFHVVCSDDASSKLEKIQFRLTKQMNTMVSIVRDIGEDDKFTLMKLYINEDVFSLLNNIRYDIIHLVNGEIGDGSGTEKFKSAIKENNVAYKKLLSEMLDIKN